MYCLMDVCFDGKVNKWGMLLFLIFIILIFLCDWFVKVIWVFVRFIWKSGGICWILWCFLIWFMKKKMMFLIVFLVNCWCVFMNVCGFGCS